MSMCRHMCLCGCMCVCLTVQSKQSVRPSELQLDTENTLVIPRLAVPRLTDHTALVCSLGAGEAKQAIAWGPKLAGGPQGHKLS